MDPDSILNFTAGEAVVAMRRGLLKSEDYVTALLAQVQRCKSLNALISQDAAQVLADARKADRKRKQGKTLGPLHGLPVLLKDTINTVRLPTTAGTPALARNRPRRDAVIVTRLLAAGAILFGKSNMHELSYGITSNNPTFGPVRNPQDPAMIAGGSSGGNAAALAARMVSATVGTDTGGSTRIPAALCGVVGFRPSLGRYPGTGGRVSDFVPISRSHDMPGPMARCVSDVALLDFVMAGVADPWRRLAQLRGKIEPYELRLGIYPDFFRDLDPEVERVVQRAMKRLKKGGVTLVEVQIPRLTVLVRATRAISIYETPADLAHYLKVNHTGVTVSKLAHIAAGADARKALQYVLGGPVSSAAYRRAVEIDRPRLQHALQLTMEGLHGLIFPTTRLPARPIGQDRTVELNGRRVRTLGAYCANTELAASAGLPGLSLPAGLTQSGLPVGLEIDGHPDRDESLLSAGFALEKALGQAI